MVELWGERTIFTQRTSSIDEVTKEHAQFGLRTLDIDVYVQIFAGNLPDGTEQSKN